LVRTFLLADVRGYTRYTREHGDQAASQLASRLAALVGSTVPKFGGELLEVRGDETLCVFASARQALRAAVDLQRRLRAPEAGAPFPVGVGMGLDAGEAVPTDGGYRGAALNIAGRLVAIAGPGEILATERLVELTGHVEGLRWGEAKRVRLKGLDRPERVVTVEPVDPLPPPLATTVNRPGRSHRWPIIAVGLGMLLVAGGWAVIHSSQQSVAARPTNRIEVIQPKADDKGGTIRATVPLFHQVGGVAFSSDSAWIGDGRGVVPVSLRTLKKRGTLPLSGGALGVAYVDGQLWATSNAPDDESIYNMSLHPGIAPRRYPVPGSNGALFSGDGVMWTNGQTGGMTQIDPGNGATGAYADVSVNQALHTQCAVAFTPDAMWAASADAVPPGSVASGGLIRVDPQSGDTKPAEAIPQHSQFAYCVSASAGALFVAATGPRVYRYNAPTGDYSGYSFRVGPAGSVVWLASAPDGLWILLNHPSEAIEVNPRGDRINTIPLAPSPVAVYYHHGLLWVAYGDMSSNRVNPI
jgi:class 3 adenylate cyclase